MNITQTQLECMQEASELIIARNLAVIDERYGPESDDPQEYHNVPHTVDTIEGVREIGKLALERGKITRVEFILLPLGASGHDLFYDAFDKSQNERRSAQETIGEMRRFPCFDREHYDMVDRLIMTTLVKQFYPRIIQSVDPQWYPSAIMADADLCSFGKPFEEFKPRAFAYLGELARTNQQRLMQYLDFEAVLLKNHQWYTEEAQELFPHALDNARAIKELQTVYAVQ